jgi:hypothetical protein
MSAEEPGPDGPLPGDLCLYARPVRLATLDT